MSEHERELLAALRSGDEPTFESLVARYHPGLVRVAAAYVKDPGAAEEVAQEAWLGLLRGLDRFEGRSSIKTWLFAILANQAKARATRERRWIPLSALSEPYAGDAPVRPDRFRPAVDPNWPRWWTAYPGDWASVPEDRLMANETREVIERAIEDLPAGQRIVITLRDVEGLTAAEVCSVLDISETNQRVLLHRARSKVRRGLERYFDEERS